MKLLNIDTNAKTVKGQKIGYITAIMYLAPYKLSGYNVCPMASKGCIAACLNTAGRGAMSSVQKARINRTKMFFENRDMFMEQLVTELNAFIKHANKRNLTPVVRLNGTSDIPWENYNIISMFPDIQFYDYTKRYNRKNIPANYHLTFSLAEDNDDRFYSAILNGMNVAVVFKNELPTTFKGVPVISGDENDVRHLDPYPCVVGLKAKGKARYDTSGFVRA